MDNPADREDLWRLILALADRKALEHLRYSRREKRGKGEVRGHSAFGKTVDEMGTGIANIPTPTPEFSHQVNVACEDLLDILKPEYKKMTLWKLEGRSNSDIAKLLGCVEETVRRKILVIRSRWQNDLKSKINSFRAIALG